jgi:hypothetical protein
MVAWVCRFGALAVLPVRDNDTAGKIPAKVALKPPLVRIIDLIKVMIG